MKVIGIIGSPRKDGNTDTLVSKILEGAEERGSDIKKYHLNDMDIKGCQSCYHCRTNFTCATDDDMQVLYKEILGSDAVVIGSPIYLGQMSAQTKAFVDRLYLFTHITPLQKKPIRTVLAFTYSSFIGDEFDDYAMHVGHYMRFAGLYIKNTFSVGSCSQETKDIEKRTDVLENVRNAGRDLVEDTIKKQILEGIYKDLINLYSYQLGWPIEPHYKNYKQKLGVIIGAVLTQDTVLKDAEPLINELDKNRSIDLEKIENTDLGKLVRIVENRGYGNVTTLKSVIKYLKESQLMDVLDFNTLGAKNPTALRELLKKYPLPEELDGDVWLRTSLYNLQNVGGMDKKTLDTIALYALNKPEFIINKYTKMMFSKIGLIEEDLSYNKAQKILVEALLNFDPRFLSEFNALIVKHGKRYYDTEEGYKECPIIHKFSKRTK